MHLGDGAQRRKQACGGSDGPAETVGLVGTATQPPELAGPTPTQS